MPCLWKTIFRWRQDFSSSTLGRISWRKTDLFTIVSRI